MWLLFLSLYSKPGNHVPFSIKPENTSMELVSPRTNSQNHGSGVHDAPLSQSNWHFPGSRDMSEVGARKADGYDNSSLDPHQGGNIFIMAKSFFAFAMTVSTVFFNGITDCIN